MKLKDQALATAQTQVGQKENPIGSNWGHPVQDYLLSVGIGFAASWCMSFVYWCFEHAAVQSGVPNPLTKTGGVLAQWNTQLKARIIPLENQNPHEVLQPGDIMIIKEGPTLGHTGIVESIDADGTIHTIEGNTDTNGSREGYEVARRTRHWKSPLIGFLRFD